MILALLAHGCTAPEDGVNGEGLAKAPAFELQDMAANTVSLADFEGKVVLISPQYVRPYLQRNKTDRADVKGLFEAYRNSDIHPVPIKTLAQQQLMALHRIRSTWMRTRVGRINMVRGLLREFGFVIPVGARHLLPGVKELIEDAEVQIPSVVREMLD